MKRSCREHRAAEVTESGQDSEYRSGRRGSETNGDGVGAGEWEGKVAKIRNNCQDRLVAFVDTDGVMSANDK